MSVDRRIQRAYLQQRSDEFWSVSDDVLDEQVRKDLADKFSLPLTIIQLIEWALSEDESLEHAVSRFAYYLLVEEINVSKLTEPQINAFFLSPKQRRKRNRSNQGLDKMERLATFFSEQGFHRLGEKRD